MPQLKSGRLVGVSADLLVNAINLGTDESIYAAILAYRLNVSTPTQLKDFLAIAYYREGEGVPLEATAYPSGFLVKDVLAGNAGWRPEEVAEFAEWLDADPRVNAYIEESFQQIGAAILNSPIWSSPLVADD